MGLLDTVTNAASNANPASLAVNIASGIMQAKNSAAARSANAKERAHMQDLIDKLQSPDFDTSLITPEEYAVVEKYVPQVADYVAELAPQTVKAASEGAVAGREAQMAALDRLRNLGQSGEDTQSRLLTDQALQGAAAQRAGQSALISQQAQRRGMGGSGMELVSQLMNQQNGNQLAQNAAQNAAMQSYNTKLQALRDSANLGGNIRNQDVDMEAKNAGIINDYNQRAAASRQTYNNNSANTLNDAQLKNINASQSVADKNVAGMNQAVLNQRNDQNKYDQVGYGNQADKLGIQSKQIDANMAANVNEAKDKNNTIAGIAGAVDTFVNPAKDKKKKTKNDETDDVSDDNEDDVSNIG